MKKYALLFFISFFLFLIGNLPANLLDSSVRQLNVNIATLEGSIWQGRTQHSKLGVIKWDFLPLALLQAKLSWRMDIEQEVQHRLVFDIGVNIFKQLQLRDIAGTLSSTTLKMLALLPDNIANATSFVVQINELNASWDTDDLGIRPNELQGLLQVKNLNILGEHLGDYQLHIDSENQQLNGVITEQDAQIKVQLKATLSPANLLNIQGDINTSNQNIRTLLDGIGIKDKVVFDYQL
ncbi:hypothetical protein [uncultured Gammaproteobacteria bacterium]|uniref:type II secretion system protein N n=1 Tax=Bathymodiolus heckerae thiotrophic gill symbiont TaxID=1052212 RepID=UPI0010B96341|nr:type II secretion system protein N [Bathymodiolus heckerae thiotrophic gill symbiont]CAC9452872.1 hypothetical protein [uncultured Gammaproteobacteria bacterium]SMN13705.1 hypothetical protein BHECKSOX2_828 [Bathymodiolus heckerae thiotrophic gill symbiont]SMN15779.1 hypothetical protein CRYPD_709 [uncultured Candidatus Thioglobus sp.]